MNEDHKIKVHKLLNMPICQICGGAGNSLPITCPGKKLTLSESSDIGRNKLDYANGKWIIIK